MSVKTLDQNDSVNQDLQMINRDSTRNFNFSRYRSNTNPDEILNHLGNI